MTNDDDSATAIYFVVADRERQICSYTWRIGWSGTSFYAKARYTPLAAFKISLHGPDSARPALRPGFKIAMETAALPGAMAAGGVYCGSVAIRPQWFSGRRVKNGVTHVATFRTTWDLFLNGVPSAPGLADIHPRTVGLVIPPPGSLKAVDLDIYVSDKRPYWEKETNARRDNACVGPIQNKAGQYLTGTSFRRSALDRDVPPAVLALKSQSDDDRIRGIGTGVDGRGVLWIVEQWMSPSALQAAVTDQASFSEPNSAQGQARDPSPDS